MQQSLKKFVKNYFLSVDWLSNLSFSNPVILLQKGALGSWDEFGVRDPALLTDENGCLIRENDRLVMYYTGSSQKGVLQGVGRAISYDDGKSWHKEPDYPVLAPIQESWDYPVATTAWVTKFQDGIYRMYYQGGFSSKNVAPITLIFNLSRKH